MKYLPLILLVSLYSCGTKRQWEGYKDTVNRADSICITYKDPKQAASLSGEEIVVFKEIATQNKLEVEHIRKFKSNIQVDLYAGSRKLGYYQIRYGTEGSFVNFHSDRENFGFQMSYGLGRFLDEIWATRRTKNVCLNR